MFNLTLVLHLLMLGLWSAAASGACLKRSAPDQPHWTSASRKVTYDGPRYTMTDDDKAALRESWSTGSNWTKPEGMPIINIEPGTHLDLGAGSGNVSTPHLKKRYGEHQIAAYYFYGCRTEIVNVQNFGCGTGCVNMPVSAFSGEVFQEFHGNPYPTMDVWVGSDCQGQRQHFGVDDVLSCTDSAYCAGYRSFIGWYDC
jgi:hypothetical protein